MNLESIQKSLLIGVIILISLVFLWLIQDFVLPIFWAALIATVFYPLREKLQNRYRINPILSSLLTLFAFILLVLLPLLLIGAMVLNETASMYHRIASGELDVQAPLQKLESYLPLVSEYMDKFGLEMDKLRQGLSKAALSLSSFAASKAVSIGQNTLRFFVLVLIMLYLLYFFLRDGKELFNSLIRRIPLGDEIEITLFSKFASVSRATLKGTFVVGFLQGFLGGLFFWILNIQAPFFWGVVMTVLSILPAVGSAIVWAPAAVVLIVSGAWLKGIVLLLGGTLVIGLADNFLRPLLVGKETQLPDYLILLSTLGGLTLMGISGFVIGPIIASLFVALWEIFGQVFGCEQDLRGQESKGEEGKS